MEVLQELMTAIAQVAAVALTALGALAFLVSVITEVLKKTEVLGDIPTALQVVATSMVLCPVALVSVAAWYGIVITWYMVFASFVAAFIVALIAMDGWERLNELAEKLLKK